MISWLADVLHAAGVAVVEHPDWRDHGRPGSFAPGGVLVHHTGPGVEDRLIEMCRRGRDDLPGPLCHAVITRDGAWHVIAAGRANHAGNGVLPWDRTNTTVGGNAYLVGVELTNAGDGTDIYPAKQIRSMLAGVNSILVHNRWDVARCTTHAAFARPAGRKTDPKGPCSFSPGPSTWTPQVLRAALAEEATMPSAEEIADAVWMRAIRATNGNTTPAENVLRYALHFAEEAAADIDRLAASIAQRLPGVVDHTMVKAAVLEALAEQQHPSTSA